ncbi:MAG: hypothetical protein U0800_21775 [Isosphaeraceae bacterium]
MERNPIAQAFQQKRKEPRKITDGARTPRDQANAILNMSFKDDDGGKAVSKLYSNGANIQEILAAIKSESDPSKLLDKVTDVIQGQVDRGKFISGHLMQNSVDIQSRGLSAKDVATLKELVLKSGGKFLDETKAKAGPHYHVTFGPPVASSTPLP